MKVLMRLRAWERLQESLAFKFWNITKTPTKLFIIPIG